MNKSEYTIYEFTLAQRQVLYEYRKQSNLNRADIELMCFALKNFTFTIYQARRLFPNTNPQQTVRQIKKLVGLTVLQKIPCVNSGKPQLYILSENGKNLLNQYFDIFTSKLASLLD